MHEEKQRVVHLRFSFLKWYFSSVWVRIWVRVWIRVRAILALNFASRGKIATVFLLFANKIFLLTTIVSVRQRDINAGYREHERIESIDDR